MLSGVGGGCHSILEQRYLDLVERRHGLPTAERQAVRGGAGRRWYHDVRYRRWRLVVELDGALAHPSEAAVRDRRRDNACVLGGDRVLRYGWAEVVGRPCLVAAEVAAVLRAAGWRGVLRRCGDACRVPPHP